jgi:molybdopterin/thiamine biosynthesis adenylyltransferase
MPEETYTRQLTLGLTIPQSVTVVGCGGVGSRFAYEAAMTGVPNLYLFDPDVLEESNRNRLPFCQGSLGRPKVEVVKDFILAIRPETIVVAVQDKLEGILLDIQLSVSEFIVDCTDSPKAQFTIYNACKRAGVKFIRAGYDGTHITGTSVVSGWIKTNVEEENYTVNPSWAVPAGIIALLAVGKMEKWFNQEISLDISEIGNPVVERQKKLTARCNQEDRRRR